MWFRLSLALGVPVQELQQKTTSTEFSEWIKFLEMDFQSKKPEHYYLGQIAFILAQVNSDPKKYKPKFNDFLIEFGDPPQKQPPTPQETKQFFQALASGKIKK